MVRSNPDAGRAEMIDVKTLCLGVLSRGDASGYEIRKEFEEGPFSNFSDAGFGSIYPALRKLLEDGLISIAQHGTDARPDKKVYRITAAGRQVLCQAVLRHPAPDRLRSDFMFMILFSHLMPSRHLERILTDRIEDYERLIEDMERRESCDAAHSPPGEKFVHGLGLAMHRAAAAYLEEHRHQLLEGIRLQTKVAE